MNQKNQTPSSPSQRRRRQWLALWLALLVMGIILGALLLVERDHAERLERDRLQVQARVIDAYLEQKLGGVNHALQGVRDEMRTWQGAQFRQQAASSLRLLADATPGVRLMGIADAQGAILATSLMEPVVSDGRQREFFRTPKDHPDPALLYVSAPDGGGRGAASIMVGRAMLDADGKFAGLVYARLDPEFFNVVMRSVLYAPDMLVGISTQDGQVFVHADSGLRVVNTDVTSAGSLFNQHRASGQTASLLRGNAAASGVDSLMALRTVRHPGLLIDKPLVVQVSRGVSAVYQPWRERLGLYASFYALLVLACAWGLQVYHRQRLAQERLAAAQERERQDNAERLELALGGAELGLWDIATS